MPDFRRANCRNCNRHRDEIGPLSWTGLCGTCGPLLSEQANKDLHYHQGPVFDRWRERMAASVGARLIDETD